MDDGMQFAHEDRSHYPAGPDTTKTIYKAGFHTYSGTTWQYIGNDKAEYDVVIAKIEAENARIATFKGWKPKPTEIATEIIEPEQPVVEEPVQVEEVVEQSGEAVEASPDTTEEAASVEEPQKFEVFVQEAAKPVRRVYNGNSPKEARTAVASWVRKCVRVYTKFEGVMLQFRAEEQGFYWDHYDQYCKDMRAGLFDAAFERDWRNDEAIRLEGERQMYGGRR